MYSNRSLTLGARTFNSDEIARFDSGTTGVVLYALGAVTSTRYNTPRLASASSGFTVPGGKTLTIVGIMSTSNSASAIFGFVPLYGDTDVGVDGGSAPTNPVYIAGYSATTTALGMGIATNDGSKGCALNFSVPTGKLPCIRSMSANTTYTIYCFID